MNAFAHQELLAGYGRKNDAGLYTCILGQKPI
jgi:hypothetical protein